MSDKLKVYILANSNNGVEDVCSKISASRPVVTSLFSDLKSFLTHAMQDKPDCFAISVDFKHPKASKFPKFFKMAMNVPVIAFCENSDQKSIKAVNLSQADYKISSKVNAHNLWMKVLLLDKKKKKDEDKKLRASKKKKKTMAERLQSVGGGGSQMAEAKKNKGHQIVKKPKP